MHNICTSLFAPVEQDLGNTSAGARTSTSRLCILVRSAVSLDHASSTEHCRWSRCCSVLHSATEEVWRGLSLSSQAKRAR
eukprot:594324-Rhodomonas_salina.4